jgi:hypothetical protein
VSTDSKEAGVRAEANLKKRAQALEGAKAMAEYEAERVAVAEKTARLKALRLAKEAAEATAKANEKPTSSGKKRRY